MAETDYGRACSAAGGCTYSNLHCTYPECIWGRAVARSRTTDRRPPDPAAAELAEALKAILADMPIIDCDRLHHTKKDVHGDSICPVEIRLDAAVSRARALLAKYASPRDAT